MCVVDLKDMGVAEMCVLEERVELKSSAEKFFNFLKSQNQQIPSNVHSEKLHAVEIHEGEWNTPGSVKLWKYNIGIIIIFTITIIRVIK